jgi:hypothetical protein
MNTVKFGQANVPLLMPCTNLVMIGWRMEMKVYYKKTLLLSKVERQNFELHD